MTTLEWRNRAWAMRLRLRRRLAVILSVLAVVGAAGAGVTLGGRFAIAQMLGLLNMSARGFVWLVGAFEEGLDVWAVVLVAGRALGEAVSSPPAVAGFLAFEFVGVAALYALHRVLRIGRGGRR